MGDVRTAEKRRVVDSYEKLLTQVQDLSAMCETDTWKRYYAELRAMRQEHARQILTEEKTRQMVAHQEAIKIIDAICEYVAQPVSKLQDLCVAMPLFASEYHTRAQWNMQLGRVDLSSAR
jgi:hypothetical protein